MKFSKVLLGSAVLAAAAIGFMGCADDDDPNDMISGSNNNYSIEYTNDSKEISRGYNTSNLKHAGALVKINYEEATGDGGMMGFMFDYEQTSGLSSFDIIGVKSDGVYYVSRFENITSEGLQGNNFGATTTANASNGEAYEKEYVAYSASKTFPNWDSTAKTAYIWFVQAEDGSNYKVYSLTEAQATSAVVKDDNAGKLYDSDNNEITGTLLATIPTEYTEQTQKRYGVYANVYANSSVKGTWEILGSYKAADVVED